VILERLFRRAGQLRPQDGATATIRSFRSIVVCRAGREGEMLHHLKAVRHELDKLIEFCEQTVAERQKGGA